MTDVDRLTRQMRASRCCDWAFPEIECHGCRLTREALDVIEGLRATVDKVRKTTDGVPMADGMTVFSLSYDYDLHEYHVHSEKVKYVVYPLKELGDCFSTSEAVEAAKEGK